MLGGRLSGRMLRRMVLMFLAAMLLPIVIISVMISSQLARRSREDIARNQIYSMSQVAGALEGYLSHIDQVTLDLLYSQPVQEALSGRALSGQTTDLVTQLLSSKMRQEGVALLFVDARGRVYTTATHNFRADTARSSDIYRLFSGHYGKLRWTFGPISLSPADRLQPSEIPVLQAGRMMHHLDLNGPPGFLIVQLPAGKLATLLTDPLMQPGTRYIMLTGHGRVVHDTQGLIPPGEALEAPDLMARLKGGEVSCLGDSSLGNQLFVMRTLSQEGFALISCLPEAVVNRSLNDMRAALLGESVISALLAVALAVVFSGYYSAPIGQIARAMRRVRGGDFTPRVDIRRRDEIGELADTFNVMTQDIDQLMRRAQEDQEQLRKAHMSALMSQINPHFLYNTLDNILMLARQSGDPRLPFLIAELSNLLRVTLSGGREWITLGEELSHVRSYLGIMRLRGGDDFAYEVTCEAAVEDMQVQKLILQPLVENALIHGLKYRDGDGLVRVAARAVAEGALITVKDNGPGLTDEDICRLARLGRQGPEAPCQGDAPAHGVGLCNVLERLRITYGADRHTVAFSRSELGGLEIALRLCAINFTKSTNIK